MHLDLTLTTEQQFSLAATRQLAESASKEQLVELLVQAQELLYRKDMVLKSMLRGEF